MTRSSKNVCARRLDHRAERRGHLHQHRPVLDLFHRIITRLEEDAARVADTAGQRRQRPQQDLALLDRRTARDQKPAACP